MARLRIIFFTCMFMVLGGFSAWAQTPQTPQSAPQAEQSAAAAAEQAEQTAPAARQQQEAPPAPLLTIDLEDPAIQAALNARNEADAALTQALRAQAEAAERQALEGAGGADGAKTSLIPSDAEELKALLSKIGNKLMGWLTSLSFLVQVGVIVGAFILSPLIAAIVRRKVPPFRDAPTEATKLRVVREYVYRARSLLRPVVLVVLLILAAPILKAIPMAGQTWLVKLAQSLAIVFLLYKLIKEFVENDILRKLATWTVIPLGLLMVFGYYDDLVGFLNGVEVMAMGGTPITLMTIILLLFFGAIFFKIGNLANAKGQTAIRSQEGLDVATQEVIAKIFQIVLFTLVFIMVLGAAKVPLSGLVVIFSALSLGIGLGLQPVAANFVSGMIILFDRSVRVGDFVVLPDGQEGFVEAINMRQTVVETTDGKDIMVPNTKFIEDAYENWTHKDPRQRYEVHFTVGFDTDLDILEGLIIPAFLEHSSVLKEPEMPDLEFREFGEYGAKMAVEFWCSGIDDGPNKFTSDLNFIVWRLLRDNDIKIPFPQMVVHKK